MCSLTSRASTGQAAEVVVTKHPASDTVRDTPPMELDPDEYPQLQRLYDLKHQGYQRQDPSAPPVRKGFTCDICKIQFADEEILKKHKNFKHAEKKDMEKKLSTGDKEKDDMMKSSMNEAVLQKIPILSGQSREYNCLECSFQADGKGSSKSLLRHAKQTKHNTSSLEEKCYTCQKVCTDFEELMIHRRENHKDSINFCRYLSENSCKFGNRCWYSHDETKKNDSPKQVFQKAKASIPPDMMRGLNVLLSDLIAQHLEKKRPPGNIYIYI